VQLLKLQDDINTSEVKAALKIHSKPQIDDLVLAKFYEEDRSAYNWYRGQILDINGEKIKVFYLGKKCELVFFNNYFVYANIFFKTTEIPTIL